MIATYFTIGFVIAKWPSKKKPVEVVVSSSNDGAIPDIDSPEFEAWANTDGNLDKYFATLA